MTKGKTDPPQAYGDEKYWDSRYSNDAGSFDWYQRYTGLSPLVNKYVPKTNRVLMVGCGNAAISEDMVNDGYRDIVNVDISSVVIDAMQKKYLDYPELSYIRLDVRDMRIFKDAMFDAAIDKVWTKCTLLSCANAKRGPQSVEARRRIYTARPGSKRPTGSSSGVALDPLLFKKDDPQFSLDDPDLHYVYVCEKDGVRAG